MKNFNCSRCGQFIAFKELDTKGGASMIFVPSSHTTYEELHYQGKKCTEQHGKPFSNQNVRQDLVSYIL